MKARILRFLGCLLITSVLVSIRAQPQSEPGQNAKTAGRFQIISIEGEYGGRITHSVMRIDTQTGNAWTYETNYIRPAKAGDHTQRWDYWRKVDEQWIIHDNDEEMIKAINSQPSH